MDLMVNERATTLRIRAQGVATAQMAADKTGFTFHLCPRRRASIAHALRHGAYAYRANARIPGILAHQQRPHKPSYARAHTYYAALGIF